MSVMHTNTHTVLSTLPQTGSLTHAISPTSMGNVCSKQEDLQKKIPIRNPNLKYSAGQCELVSEPQKHIHLLVLSVCYRINCHSLYWRTHTIKLGAHSPCCCRMKRWSTRRLPAAQENLQQLPPDPTRGWTPSRPHTGAATSTAAHWSWPTGNKNKKKNKEQKQTNKQTKWLFGMSVSSCPVNHFVLGEDNWCWTNYSYANTGSGAKFHLYLPISELQQHNRPQWRALLWGTLLVSIQ